MSAPIGNNYAVGNEGGRPTEYNKKYCKIAYKLCLMGATDKDLAESFEVSETTITNWKQKHKEFLAAIKKGKEVADSNVAEKLYKRAMGYKIDEVTFEKIDSKQTLEITSIGEIKSEDSYKKRVVVKEVIPDTTAQIFWLKNRQPGKWRDKTIVDNNIKLGQELEDEANYV